MCYIEFLLVNIYMLENNLFSPEYLMTTHTLEGLNIPIAWWTN